MVSISQTHQYSWEITHTETENNQSYTGVCRVESPDEQCAVIYHLDVPEEIRNNGVGKQLIDTAESIISSKTNADILYVQVGMSDSIEYFLQDKCGYSIDGTEYSEALGKIISGQKQI